MDNMTVMTGRSSILPLQSASRGWWEPGGMRIWRRPGTDKKERVPYLGIKKGGTAEDKSFVPLLGW